MAEPDQSVIPHGPYCYSRVPGSREITPCPYWSRDWSKPELESGYCEFLKKGDWMPREDGGTFLLWDMCKECGINFEDNEGVPQTIVQGPR